MKYRMCAAVRHTAPWARRLCSATASSSNGRPSGASGVQVSGLEGSTGYRLSSHSSVGQVRRAMARSSRMARYRSAIEVIQIDAIATPYKPALT